MVLAASSGLNGSVLCVFLVIGGVIVFAIVRAAGRWGSPDRGRGGGGYHYSSTSYGDSGGYDSDSGDSGDWGDSGGDSGGGDSGGGDSGGGGGGD